MGIDDGEDTRLDFGSGQPWSTFSCDRPNPDVQPGSTSTLEWNTITMDFDLTKYPGAKATERFVRRSKPLQNGSDLMFEIRGSITVERK